MNRKTFILGVALSAVLFFAACGDDSSSTSVNNGSFENVTQSSSEKAEELSSSAEDAVCSSSEAVFGSSLAGSVYDAAKKTLTDNRDGLVYKTVTIGGQIWMAENLNYADNYETPSLKGNSWCYNNSPEYCDKYGRLYSWAAAIDSVKLANGVANPLDCGYHEECGLTGTVQGICPEGWHLPNDDEWNVLFTTVGGSLKAGRYLKSQTGWYSNGNGTDIYSFSALPAGNRELFGFDEDGVGTSFWSSTEYNNDYAYSMRLIYSEMASLSPSDKYYGFSIRCLRD